MSTLLAVDRSHHHHHLPHHLPHPLTPLVGREREIEEVVALLRPEGVRLLTLTGPGGVGKTRLAVEAARRAAAKFVDGAAFVSLAPVHDPRLVAPTIARALGVPEAGARPSPERLTAWLRDRQFLLVLDNLEQVLEAAPLVARLMTACPRLTVLTTSRVLVRLSGEYAFVVPPLALPIPAAQGFTWDSARTGAVRLFAERARAADPGFNLTEANIDDVAEVVRRLDGLPLAIELAAARTRHLPLADLLDRLGQRLPLLTGGPRDAPARHRTLRGAIAWSHDLLPAEEQTAFRRLAVFVGGFTLEAAEAVVGDGERAGLLVPRPPSPVLSVLEGVAALVDASLLRREEGPENGPDGGTRFAMLETVREFGLEALAAEGEEAATRRRHAEWCVACAEAGGPKAQGAEKDVWFARLTNEQDNLRAALAWTLDQGDAATAVRLTAALWPFWEESCQYAEGQRWLEATLALAGDAADRRRPQVLIGAGRMAGHLCDYPLAIRHQEEALDAARAIGDGEATAFAANNLGVLDLERGNFEQARAQLASSRQAAETGGYGRLVLYADHNLGDIARLQGDAVAAVTRYEAALLLARALGEEWYVPKLLCVLGFAALDLGDDARAMAVLQESLNGARDPVNLWNVTECLEGLARVEMARGQAVQAARLFGAAEARHDEMGAPVSPTALAYYEPTLVAMRVALGAEALATAWQSGRALSLEAAVAEALALTFPVTPAPAPPAVDVAVPHGLTPREVEVLRLLVGRRTDREIADALFISPKTTGFHVANILGKLGVANRRDAAALALRDGLIAPPATPST